MCSLQEIIGTHSRYNNLISLVASPNEVFPIENQKFIFSYVCLTIKKNLIVFFTHTLFFSSHAHIVATHFLFHDSQHSSKLHKILLNLCTDVHKIPIDQGTFTTLADRSSFKIKKFSVLLLMTLQSWTLFTKVLR